MGALHSTVKYNVPFCDPFCDPPFCDPPFCDPPFCDPILNGLSSFRSFSTGITRAGVEALERGGRGADSEIVGKRSEGVKRNPEGVFASQLCGTLPRPCQSLFFRDKMIKDKMIKHSQTRPHALLFIIL